MKIRDTKGTFHAKMGTIKERNGMDLTEAEDIKKRWQEYTKELYRKDLQHPDNHDGVLTLIMVCLTLKAMFFISWYETTEWERLEISSRKLEIPWEHFMQRWAR